MNDESGKYVKYLWDPNSYINIMVYNFDSGSNSNLITLGISHIPFSTAGNHYLEGLSKTDYSHLTLANFQMYILLPHSHIYSHNSYHTLVCYSF